MTGDAMMTRIMEAIGLHQRGENEAAHTQLGALWAEIGADGDPLHRCALAHYVADLQNDPADALTWNRRALDAAEMLRENGVEHVLGSVSLRSFFPSLHLNLAEDYRLLGDNAAAAEQARLARAALAGLPEEGFVAMIRGGIDRIEHSLAGAR